MKPRRTAKLRQRVISNSRRNHSFAPVWDGSQLVHRREIRAYCDSIAREFRPSKIVLFGSYAYCKPTPHSDVDLLVVMPLKRGCRPIRQTQLIRSRLAAPFALDLLVRTPSFLDQRLREQDMFIVDLMKRGEIMYETEHA